MTASLTIRDTESREKREVVKVKGWAVEFGRSARGFLEELRVMAGVTEGRGGFRRPAVDYPVLLRWRNTSQNIAVGLLFSGRILYSSQRLDLTGHGLKSTVVYFKVVS